MSINLCRQPELSSARSRPARDDIRSLIDPDRYQSIRKLEARLIDRDFCAAQAGYDRGLSGLAPDTEDERCRDGRFAYINGWSRGHRDFLAAQPPKEFSFDFFLGGTPKERSLI